MDNKKRKQKVQMPASIRKKLMAATSMLLVAAIMLVSSSYAWFTLSTAPEVTGITTSVGANGNLEIALLNTETAQDTSLITSNTGDSMAATNQTKAVANGTWGNLVDLDDASYGLTNIALYPAALNETADGVISSTTPLSTPTYGADGRVNIVNPNTFTGIYNGTAFPVDANGRGVRAVGVSTSMTPRQIAFNTAKANVQAKGANASKPLRLAVADESTMLTLLQLATSISGSSMPDSYDYAELEAMLSVAEGVQKSLDNIVSTYANAIAAKVASDTTNFTNEADVVEKCNQLSAITSANELQQIIGSYTNATNVLQAIDLGTLKTAQDSVAGALAAGKTLMTGKTDVTGEDEFKDTDATTINNNVIVPILGSGFPHKFLGADGQTPVNPGDFDSLMDLVGQVYFVYLTGGSASTVARYTGEIYIDEFFGVKAYIAAEDNGNIIKTDLMMTLVGQVENLSTPGATGSVNNITEYYGYILDFAFRTNAADSYLQLQTSGINRVYSNTTETDLATQGAGSTVTFEYAEDLTATQAENLLKAIRIVFFNPVNGNVFETAAIGDIASVAATDTTAAAATGKIYIISVENTKYKLGKDAYVAGTITVPGDGEGAPDTTAEGYVLNSTFKVGEGADAVAPSDTNTTNYAAQLTVTEYNALSPFTAEVSETTLKADETPITALPQSEAFMVSALVYLDGENIDNGAVGSNGTSGDLKLNLQFSSSENLVPMENTALKEMKNTVSGGNVTP